MWGGERNPSSQALGSQAGARKGWVIVSHFSYSYFRVSPPSMCQPFVFFSLLLCTHISVSQNQILPYPPRNARAFVPPVPGQAAVTFGLLGILL